MKNTLIAGLAALAIAITPAPVVAQSYDEPRPQHEDFATAIFALIALGVLGHALIDNDDHKRGETVHVDRDRFGPSRDSRDYGGIADRDTRDWWRDRDRDGRTIGNRDTGYRSVTTTSGNLPASCLRTAHTPRGVHRYFGRRCLENNYGNLRSLPNRCTVEFTVNHRTRRGYSRSCLADFGYAVDRHR